MVTSTTTISVLTQHNDNSRTGANLQEVILNTSNVNPQQFGKLFTYPVQGHMYAQPLYLSNVDIPNRGTHNIVYIATMHNIVYAFDADDSQQATTPLWKRQLEPSIKFPDPNIGPAHQDTNTKQMVSDYHDIAHEVGIISTPVISLAHNAIYVVAATKDPGKSGPDAYAHHLHALDLATGEEKFNGPVKIQASFKGNGYRGDVIVNGQITFTSHRQIQRASLLLTNDIVYMAFAAYGDADPYHGWVLAYSASTLQQIHTFTTTPNHPAGRGGIWQAGQGPAADDQNILYFLTGNGGFNNGSDFGDSFVKLRPNLTVLDWFTPFNQQALSDKDVDVGSAGPLLIPGTDLLIGGGKEGKFFLMHKNAMGHFQPTLGNSQIVQHFYIIPPDNPNDPIGSASGSANSTHHVHGGPVFWHGPHGPWIYIWVENDLLRALALQPNGTFKTVPPPQTIVGIPNAQLGVPTSQARATGLGGISGTSHGMPGGMLSISANGNTPGTGIVWTSHPLKDNANQAVVEGIVRAYDASDLTKELWNSKVHPNRDNIGNFAKFCPPTIANGKVYMATFSDAVVVYGLQPATP